MKPAERKTSTGLNIVPAVAFALSLGITFTQVACAEENSTAAPAESQGTASVENTAPEANAAPEEKPAPKLSAGMQIPVDGTSLETFEASLAEIKNQATAEEYQTLENAIQYLMVYDLSIKRDKAKLAATLNGQTGEEIVGRVRW